MRRFEYGVDEIDVYARAAGALTSGVTVLCTRVDGKSYGTTVAAVAPVSDDPPVILACMNERSSTREAIVRSGSFTVSVLAEGQGALARQFAGPGDKFAGVAHRDSAVVDAPVLDGALATFSCRLRETATVGTHTVLFGEVREATAVDGRPLTYFGGSFGRWDRLREHATYEQMRRLVLQRDVGVGEPLDVEAFAVRLEARPDDVNNALVTLSTESLVDRLPDGRFTPAPIGGDLIESIYSARANIEIGVVANLVGRVPDEVIRTLAEIVDEMEELTHAPDGREKFLALHTELHHTIVAQSGSAQLLESYRRLSIAWAWRSLWDQKDWREFHGQRALRDLIGALRDSDLTMAIRAIQRYHDEARALAHAAVADVAGL